MTMREMADVMGLSVTTIKDQIQRLKNKGMIRRVGADKGGHWEVL